tara:strand:+ start:388 stop:987 length:600 start_codon:yes stop_codon:yes gene_type:complete
MARLLKGIGTNTITSGSLGSGVTGGGGLLDVPQTFTVFDAWRLHTSMSSGATPVVNWEREDHIDTNAGADYTMPGQLHIEGISETSSNSGIFTFPSTGKYLLWMQTILVNTTSQWAYLRPDISFDSGSTWRFLGKPYGSTNDGGSQYVCTMYNMFINISDISTQRMRFSSQNESTFTIFGDTRGTGTGFKIGKIGDYVA